MKKTKDSQKTMTILNKAVAFLNSKKVSRYNKLQNQGHTFLIILLLLDNPYDVVMDTNKELKLSNTQSHISTNASKLCQ